jgi:leucine dehydrogenase
LMLEYREIEIDGYERVVEAVDLDAGLHAFIAVHDTTMGPSLGGTRIYPYATREDALTDALRLAKGMTYKSAMAEIGLGGGKSVIIADPSKDKNEKLILAFAEAVDSLQGIYICAEDMGTTVDDMALIRTKTKYVAALDRPNSSGDPSPYTAFGVYRGIQAVCSKLWQSDSVRGKKLAIQGLGSVGWKLGEMLYWHGAKLVIADVDEQRAEQFSRQFGAKVVPIDEILFEECDVLVPCAIGGIFNDKSIPQLKCRAIAGAANNQLLEEKHGELLKERGILYAPDYVINAGGIINVAVELDTSGYEANMAWEKVNNLFEVLLSVFNIAEKRSISTSEAANDLAEHKLRYGIGKRS